MSKDIGMGFEEKTDAKIDEATGKLKEGAGDMTDDEQMEAEVKMDQAKGNLQEGSGKRARRGSQRDGVASSPGQKKPKYRLNCGRRGRIGRFAVLGSNLCSIE